MGGSSYKRYLLVVLLLMLAFNSVDGLALGLVLQEIKRDLALTDTQLGFLSGVAFALFYSIMGIPIARWADRGNRVSIISLTTILWSVMVALCGIVSGFYQLLLVRIGVAVGEAGCMPCAQSLIADNFTRSERPKATAIFMLGSPLSVVVGYFLAGWLNQFYGWRRMYMMLGIPGIILAALAWLTLKEPRRSSIGAPNPNEPIDLSDSPPSRAASAGPSLRRTCVTLWNSLTFRQLLIGYSVLYFFGAGIGQWQPAFFVRTYALGTGALGTWLALVYGVGGIVGTYGGGALASRLAPNNERLQLRTIALLCCAFGALSTQIYLTNNRYFAFAVTAATATGLAAASGPLFATIQTLVPERMRASSVAILYLFANLIGAGLGPMTTGAISDALHPWVGAQSLRFALLALCPGYLWAGLHLWCASRSVTGDLRAVQDGLPRGPG